jgi:alkylglycerol monooxygenase
VREEAEVMFNIKQNPAPIDKPLNRYVIWQMIILLATLCLFILFEHYIPLQLKIAFPLLVILTLINCGAIMEQKKWIFLIESLRMAVLLFLSFYSLAFWQVKIMIILLLAGIVVFYYDQIRTAYLMYVYRRRL